jgi:acetate---CoA ligase (ADP-forming) subunit beta
MPTLSEAASKVMLRQFHIPLAPEHDVSTAEEAVAAALEIDPHGRGVVAKLCGDRIAHKTERGLVRLNLRGGEAVRAAATDLLGAATPEDGPVSLLIAPMLSGSREFIAGVADDPQFGKVVMLGVGGVLAEAIADVVFRLVPITLLDAQEMIEDLATQRLLGTFRGEPEVDRPALCAVLVGLSDAVVANGGIVSIDVNPLIVVDGKPIAVDALVEVTSQDQVER